MIESGSGLVQRAGGGGRGLLQRGPKGALWTDGNVLYLDCSGDYNECKVSPNLLTELKITKFYSM